MGISNYGLLSFVALLVFGIAPFTISDVFADLLIDSGKNRLTVDDSNRNGGGGDGGTIIPPLTSSSSSNCGIDCEEPTLGIDSNGNRLVSNGFTYNGYSVDVEHFFTPYPLITANVGETNRADFKIYDSEGVNAIRHFSFAFGLANGQIISQSKAMIELDISFDGMKTVTVTDPENSLENIRIDTRIVSCSDDSDLDCLGVTVFHKFVKPLDFTMVATDVWDFDRNSRQNYFNHGIDIVGTSNKSSKIFLNSSDDLVFEKLSTHGYDRNHSSFPMYKHGQFLLAEHTLYQMCSSCFDESFSEIDNTLFYESRDYDKTKLSDSKLIESIKAQKVLDHLLNPLLYRT